VPRTAARPPQSQVIPVSDRLHGTDVTDNYRWLEGDVSQPESPQKVTPEVTAWTDAQNAYTRAVLDGLPGRQAIEAGLRPLMEIDSITLPAVRGSRHFFAKREGRQNQPVHYWREGPRGPDRVLVDPEAIDPSGLTTVEWLSPSQDGEVAAYGTYTSGDENTTLHLIDVATGRTLPLEIPNKTQTAHWLPDASGFVYTNLEDPRNPYTSRVMFHRMGDPVATDVVLFRQLTAAENVKLATTWGPFGALSRDGRWLLLGYWTDTKSNDVWLVDFEAFRRTGRLERRVVSTGAEGFAFGTVIDGTLFLQTTQGATKGRVVAVDASNPGEAHWRTIVPERPDAVIEEVTFAKGRLAVTYLRNAASVIEVFDFSGRSQGLVTLPGIGSAALSAEPDRTEAYLRFASFNHPETIFQIDLATPADRPAIWEQPKVPVDPDRVEVEQVWYPSKDGTRISMFLVHKKGLARTGETPTVLRGYGGFGVNITPAFTATYVPWFEAGGLLALPNLRGGGEYGEAWHEAGMLERKQNVFDDFIAAAQWLVREGYTKPERLAISGGSNGGLLTGAALTQRPELFRAVVIEVPLLDMLRYERFLMARYWVPEYGMAEDAAQFRFLLAYSPYHRVTHGTKYPAVFLTAGEHDSRVHALHARKMAAALQAATTSDPGEQPVLLWIDRDAGHGQGKPLDLRIRDAADQRQFLMWQLGMLK
jgi:prolyl oligopeptidase